MSLRDVIVCVVCCDWYHYVRVIVCVVCRDGDPRVVGDEMEGSIEICLNNSYGGICDDFWDVLDARVACMQLGFSNGKYV